MSCGNQHISNYPNIFDPSNCSLISQLLPPGPKKFLYDFMNGLAFRNPIAQVAGILQDKMGVNLAKIEALGGTGGVNDQLAGLNSALSSANTEMNAFLAHTNRLSGIGSGSPSLNQILGTMSAYNSIKDLLKNPGDCLEDNFSKAFSSLDPQIVGPFFEHFGQNMNSISNLLGRIESQLAAGGATDLAEFAGELQQLTANTANIYNTLQALRNNDANAYAIALAFVERYALGNTIISSALTDPCFAAKLAKNLILNPDFSKGLDGIAEQNGVKIPGTPVNMLTYIPSLQ